MPVLQSDQKVTVLAESASCEDPSLRAWGQVTPEWLGQGTERHHQTQLLLLRGHAGHVLLCPVAGARRPTGHSRQLSDRSEANVGSGPHTPRPQNSPAPCPGVPTYLPCSQMGHDVGLMVPPTLSRRPSQIPSHGWAMAWRRGLGAISQMGLHTSLVWSVFFNLMLVFQNLQISHALPVLRLTRWGDTCTVLSSTPRAQGHPTPASPDTPRPEHSSLSRAGDRSTWRTLEPDHRAPSCLLYSHSLGCSLHLSEPQFPHLQRRGGAPSVGGAWG